MPHATVSASRAPTPPAPTGQPVGQLTEHDSGLVCGEARPARLQVLHKFRRLGFGAELFGGAGLLTAGALTPAGGKDVGKSAPPVPTQAMARTRAGIMTVKESGRR